MISACATTGSTRQADYQACSYADESQNDCNFDIEIEITQKIGVDPEVKQEFNTAISLLNDEKYPEAIRLLKGVTGKTSKFTAPYINLGIAYARTGEMDKAEKSLKQALEINPKHPVANNELGIVYRKTGQYKKAREHYQIAVNKYPKFLPARKNLGVLCDIYMQDLDCALEQYEEYLKRRPGDEKVKIWVADVKSRL
jgi:tetratricopeptide (TPR) repeat protein